MRLNTKRVFLDLLPRFAVDTVCDVGSMNGAEARAFRAVLPAARVIAFEPNPMNLRLMAADARLRDRGIDIVPLAISDRDGEAPFFLVKADYAAAHDRRGMSSLYERAVPELRDGAVTARTARLDSVLARSDAARPRRIAMWIDVEGKSFEAIQGARGVLAETLLLHVEVETEPCIGASQKLHADVDALLESEGFVQIASDRRPREPQFNALYVRRDLRTRQRLSLRTSLLRHRARWLAGNTLRKFCPGCLRRLEGWVRRPEVQESP